MIDSSERGHADDVRRRSRRTWWAALVALAVVVGVVAAAAPAWLGGDDEPGQEASCPARLRLGEVTYQGHGELLRVPRPGQVLGAAVLPGCGDVQEGAVQASAIPGVDPSTAVLANGGLWLADNLGSVPEDVQLLTEPVGCSRPGTVRGDWVAVRGPAPDRDGELVAPYVAHVQADEGDGLPLEEWASVRIAVHVTADTAGGTDAALVRDSLRGDAPVRAVVTCDGDRFVAEALEPAR